MCAIFGTKYFYNQRKYLGIVALDDQHQYGGSILKRAGAETRSRKPAITIAEVPNRVRHAHASLDPLSIHSVTIEPIVLLHRFNALGLIARHSDFSYPYGSRRAVQYPLRHYLRDRLLHLRDLLDNYGDSPEVEWRSLWDLVRFRLWEPPAD